jgi:hypothetical protein
VIRVGGATEVEEGEEGPRRRRAQRSSGTIVYIGTITVYSGSAA